MLGLVAVAACGRLRFDDRPIAQDGPRDTSGVTGIVRVQKEPATLSPIKCNAPTCSAVLPAATQAGDLIVALITINDTAMRGITGVADDQGGSSYVLAVDRTIVQGSNFGRAAIYYREDVPAASMFSVTVSADQLTFIDLAIVEYSGLPATGAFSGMATNACGVCPGVDGGTLVDGGLSVGVFTTPNADVLSITEEPGWYALASEATPLNAVMGAEDRIGAGNTLASWTTGFTGPKVGVSAKFGL